MTDLTEERLGELLTRLTPPPDAWVQAAAELPRARRAIEDLVELADRDRELRAALLADLEQALRDVGVEPRPRLMESLRSGLTDR
ncbi:MAG TPA: hypothetical protein VKR21_04965 [Solirubrobacteraceae bacterium]|nr:hypothetical protein [Solirubrobacteraceae bacterium]